MMNTTKVKNQPISRTTEFPCRACRQPIPVRSAIAAESLRPEDLMVTSSGKKDLSLVKCPACGLVQAADLQVSSSLISAYSQVVDTKYAEGSDFRSEGFRQDFLRVLRLAEMKGAKAPGSVVEFGAFLGLVHSLLRKMPEFSTTTYVGIEPSEWAVAQARAQGRNVVKGGIGMPCAAFEAKYDWIAAWDVIEHLENPHAFFESANQVAKTDSWLLVNTPNWNSAWRHIFRRRWWFIEPMHRVYFTRATLAKIAQQHGWEMQASWSHKKYLSWKYLFSRGQKELLGSTIVNTDRWFAGDRWVGIPLGQMTTVFRKQALN
jgi:SAM-dependent methyltransferase